MGVVDVPYQQGWRGALFLMSCADWSREADLMCFINREKVNICGMMESKPSA